MASLSQTAIFAHRAFQFLSTTANGKNSFVRRRLSNWSSIQVKPSDFILASAAFGKERGLVHGNLILITKIQSCVNSWIKSSTTCERWIGQRFATSENTFSFLFWICVCLCHWWFPYQYIYCSFNHPQNDEKMIIIIITIVFPFQKAPFF